MIKVVTSKTDYNSEFTEPLKYATEVPSIFLAGPCPRHDYDKLDWRPEAIKYLEELGFDGVVFNPTNKYFNRNTPDELRKQVQWEVDAMAASDVVIFWIPRSESMPAFTTNVEIGTFLNGNRNFEFEVGMPDDAIKNDYIKIRLDMIDKKYYNNLKDLMKKVIQDVGE